MVLRLPTIWTFRLMICGLVFGASSLGLGAAGQQPDEAGKQYADKKQQIEHEIVQKHVELALSAIEQGRLSEAQEQLRRATEIDPMNEAVLAAWVKLAEKTPAKEVSVRVALDDGNVPRGTCLMHPLLVRNPHGIVMVPMEEFAWIDFLGVWGKRPLVRVKYQDKLFEGNLISQALVIRTELGTFTAPVEKIRALAINSRTGLRPVVVTPEERKAELEFAEFLEKAGAKGTDAYIIYHWGASRENKVLKGHVREAANILTLLVPSARVGVVSLDRVEKGAKEPTVIRHLLLTGDRQLMDEFFLRYDSSPDKLVLDDPELTKALMLITGPDVAWRPEARKAIVVCCVRLGTERKPPEPKPRSQPKIPDPLPGPPYVWRTPPEPPYVPPPPPPPPVYLPAARALCVTWMERTGGKVYGITSVERKSLEPFQQVLLKGYDFDMEPSLGPSVVREIITCCLDPKWRAQVGKVCEAYYAKR